MMMVAVGSGDTTMCDFTHTGGNEGWLRAEFDQDADGTMTVSELRALMASRHIMLSKPQALDIIQAVNQEYGTQDTQQQEETLEETLDMRALSTIITSSSNSRASQLLRAAAGHITWGYCGSDVLEPANWGLRFPDANLDAQSPINLPSPTNDTETVTTPLVTAYPFCGVGVDAEFHNNGHTIAVSIPYGYTLTGGPIGDSLFELFNIHFHTPSEHAWDGKLCQAEFHLVHHNLPKEDHAAVIGVLFQASENDQLEGHPFLTQFLDGAAQVPRPGMKARSVIDVCSLLELTTADYEPLHAAYSTYEGSLTTPPCSEIVTWIVLNTPRVAPAWQLEMLASIFECPTNRPLQALNNRPIRAGAATSVGGPEEVFRAMFTSVQEEAGDGPVTPDLLLAGLALHMPSCPSSKLADLVASMEIDPSGSVTQSSFLQATAECARTRHLDLVHS